MGAHGLKRLKRWLVLSLASGGVMALPYCPASENFNEFRTTAGPSIQSGIKTLLSGGEDNSGAQDILFGIIDGLFAIVAPD